MDNSHVPPIGGYNRARHIYSLPQAPPRIIKIDGRNYSIQTYDLDNGYPQRIESIINASPTAKDCVKIFTKYLIGNGCTDTTFYKSKINARGLTPDKLLRMIVKDYGKFYGFAIHVNYNALYRVSSVNYVAFKTTRIGMEPDMNGRIAIHPNWYNTIRLGKYVAKTDIDYIWKFNPDPDEIQRQVDHAGGWDKYNGQIYWYSDNVDDYPLSPYDEVIEPMITEIKSNTTTKNNVENNFQLKVVYIDKGKTEDEDERNERDKVIKNFIGPQGDSVLVFESTSTAVDGKANDVPEIITVDSKLNDALFKYSDDKVRGQIYRAAGQNAILHSDLTQGRYNQNQLPESQMYYNTLITPDRLIIEEAMSEIFSIFEIPINPSGDYSIIPLPVTTIPVTTTVTDNTDANATDNNQK